MVSNKFKSIFFVILSTFLVALGQLFWKLGVSLIKTDSFIIILKSALNFYFITGSLLYGIAAILVVVALNYGNLSLVHPLLTFSQVWTLFFAYYYLSETINSSKIIGVSFILLGSLFISWHDDGGKK